MKSVIVKRGIDGSDNIVSVTEMFTDMASVKELMGIIATSSGAMRMCIKIDTHHDDIMADVFMSILDGIDDAARDKGIEVRLRIMCMCSECIHKSEKIRDSIRWMSRWDF